MFIILYNTGLRSLDDSTATRVYQAVRVLRLVRFTSLLRRLYATAAVAQQSILPGLHVRPDAAQHWVTSDQWAGHDVLSPQLELLIRERPYLISCFQLQFDEAIGTLETVGRNQGGG